MKKLIVVLVVLALSMPSMAAYIGFDAEGNPGVNPLHVDVDGESVSPPPGDTYQSWLISRSWTGPLGKDFVNPLQEAAWEIPHGQMEAYRSAQTDNASGGARNRSGGISFVAGTGEYSPTGKMFGMNYLKITVTNLKPGTEYKVRLWSFEARHVWSASSANPNSKFGVWGTTNPVAWLTNNGYPNGYAPSEMTDGTSGMPAGLVAAMGTEYGRASVMGDPNDGRDFLGGRAYMVDFYATTTPETPEDQGGALTLYGWMDATDWAGSLHMPINGFTIVPEPATVALLGLGGLALLRRKRA